ncbi:alanine racemase [Verrucomicrobiales bacterium BCK34]|nr:alanine racemase [Verrucomicrobiales bacterium BCK34]
MPSYLTQTPPPRCWVEINLPALAQNAAFCRAEGKCPIMAIVKADAYGHGLKEIARELAHEVGAFGVANVREALRIREAIPDLTVPILILSPATPEEIPAIVAAGISASVSTPEEVEIFGAEAAKAHQKASLHAAADTGMGRMGSAPESYAALVDSIRNHENCHLAGVNTHFPSADEEVEFTKQQITTFARLLEPLDLPGDCIVHIANSAGLLDFQELMPFVTMSRPGLALYGISPLESHAGELQPILEWKTRVALVREVPSGTTISYGRTFVAEKPMRVATLGIGYGDGYPRHLSGNGASVLIGGKRCPILGRITMDQIVVDISHLDGPIKSGDEAVVAGSQGNETITIAEIAKKAGTIPWAVLTGITSRVERTYLS